MLYRREEIAAAIERLAAEIAARLSPGNRCSLVGVLKGALYFTTDLARAISALPDGPSEIIVDYLCVSSYGQRGAIVGRSAAAQRYDASPLTGRNVVIVEDIIDEGSRCSILRALLGAA